MTLKDDEIAEIKARCERATAGPWKSHIEGRDFFGGDSVITTNGEDIYLTGATIDDQDFVAHARQDIPRLLQEISRLKSRKLAKKRQPIL